MPRIAATSCIANWRLELHRGRPVESRTSASPHRVPWRLELPPSLCRVSLLLEFQPAVPSRRHVWIGQKDEKKCFNICRSRTIDALNNDDCANMRVFLQFYPRNIFLVCRDSFFLSDKLCERKNGRDGLGGSLMKELKRKALVTGARRRRIGFLMLLSALVLEK